MIIMLSSCLAVTLVALLILYKLRSLHDNLEDNLNNLIKQLNNLNNRLTPDRLL